MKRCAENAQNSASHLAELGKHFPNNIGTQEYPFPVGFWVIECLKLGLS